MKYCKETGHTKERRKVKTTRNLKNELKQKNQIKWEMRMNSKCTNTQTPSKMLMDLDLVYRRVVDSKVPIYSVDETNCFEILRTKRLGDGDRTLHIINNSNVYHN